MPDSISCSGLRNNAATNIPPLIKHNYNSIHNGEQPVESLSINTGKAHTVAIGITPLDLKTNSMLSISFMATDRSQRMKGIGQWVIAQKEGSSLAYLLLNGSQEGQQVELIGRRDHQQVFYNCLEPAKQWQTLGSFDLTTDNTWLSEMECSVDMMRNTNGKVTRIKTTKTIRSNAVIRPMSSNNKRDLKEPVNVEKNYTIDTLHIVSTFEYPQGLPEEKESHISRVLITGEDMERIIVTHSKAS